MYLKSPTQKAMADAILNFGPKSEQVQERAQALTRAVHNRFGSPELTYFNASSVRVFIQKGDNPLWLHIRGRTFMATRHRITQRGLASSASDPCLYRTDDVQEMESWIGRYDR